MAGGAALRARACVRLTVSGLTLGDNFLKNKLANPRHDLLLTPSNSRRLVKPLHLVCRRDAGLPVGCGVRQPNRAAVVGTATWLGSAVVAVGAATTRCSVRQRPGIGHGWVRDLGEGCAPTRVTPITCGRGRCANVNLLHSLISTRVGEHVMVVIILVAGFAVSGVLCAGALLLLRGPTHVRTRVSHQWVVAERSQPLDLLESWFAGNGARVTRINPEKLHVRVGHRLPSTMTTRPDRLPTVVIFTVEVRTGAGTLVKAKARDDLKWTPWHSPRMVDSLRRRQRHLLQRCVAVTTCQDSWVKG